MTKQSAINARVSTSKTNIHKLVKYIGVPIQVNRTSTKAMEILVSMERNLLERIVYCAHELMLKEGKGTLKSRAIQISIRLEYNGELAKHAIIHGMTCVLKKDTIAYKASFIKSLVKRLELFNRIAADSMSYLAGVIEYTLTEVIELSANSAKMNKRATITPVDIHHAINNDQELALIFDNITIPQTGKGPIGTCGYNSVLNNSTTFGLDKLSINDNDNDGDNAGDNDEDNDGDSVDPQDY